MSALDLPIRHHRITVLAFALLVVLGLQSWLVIPRGEDPPLDVPIFSIVAVYPGANATDLERLVVREVEERIDALEDVEEIESRIVDGVATIRVEFETSEDPDAAHDALQRELDALRPRLPAGLHSLTLEQARTQDVAIAQIALVSETAPYHQLDRLAERLTDRLGALPGVRRAERWGAPERQVEVALDLGRLARLGIPAGRVLEAIHDHGADVPAGRLEAGTRVFNIRASDGFRTLDEIASTIVAAQDGRLVRVRDLARIRWAYGDSTYRALYNGRRAVFITVTQQERANIAAVRDRVWNALDEFQRELPTGITLERGFDQARIVSHRLARLGIDLLTAIALVAITLLPLGLRAASLVMLAIPLSLAIGVVSLRAAGFTINQLSIVGAVIALGLLVDDAIVVVENITRFLRAGRDRVAAAIEATRQIAAAVLGATATLILAFAPLLFLPGGPGKYIRSLPASVIATISGSLVVALTIVPWLASRILPEGRRATEPRALRALERAIHAFYAPLLDRALRRPRTALALAAAFVAASAALLPTVGFSLFPKAETPQFYVNVTAEEGASLEATLAAARFADSVIRSRPAVRAVFTSVGRDNPRIYYNVYPRRENPAVGQLFVLLDRYHRERTPALLDSLRAQLAAYPGARIEVREFENGPPIDAPIALRVLGPDLDTLRLIAAQVARVLERTPGTQYVTNPVRVRRTDLRVAVDRTKAGLLGIPTAEIDRTLRLGLVGVQAAALREPTGESRPVVVRLAGETRPRPATLDRLYVASATGRLTPLRQIADVRFEAHIPEIRRVDRERAVTVTSHVRTGFNTDRVTRRALAALDSLPLPPGYRIVPAGELESRRESFSGAGTAALAALFLVLVVLVLEFRTFRGALIVASVIPLGLAGGIIALWLTGNTLSFVAAIGAVALIGIEIKTSILLVDFTNRLRAQGTPLEQAVRQAGEVRFLPILLTTLTAIGGLLPLALQGHALYAPLAWVIIGGLVSSTLLARIVTPVLYQLWPPTVAA